MKTKKVYEVEFMEYTNCMKDTVSNNATSFKDIEYLNIGKEPFLITESEFDEYSKFGGGFRSLKFVGNIKLFGKP